MLAFTKKTGYGLIAMTYLAQLEGGRVSSARQIAERFGVPARPLMNVLKTLSATGYVASVRGAHGGYRLARRPEDVNLAEVVTVLEGPIRMAECITGQVNDAKGRCKLMERCPVADPVHRVQRKLSDFLRNVTLAEIAEPAPATAN